METGHSHHQAFVATDGAEFVSDPGEHDKTPNIILTMSGNTWAEL
jgi:hypothetical protein